MLPYLTHEMLKLMGISDNFHRNEILSEINKLFPSNPVGHMSSTCASSVMSMGESSSDEKDEALGFEESECSISLSRLEESMKSSPDIPKRRFGKARSKMISQVSNPKEVEHRMSDVHKIATCLRTKELSLWPNSDESKLNEENQINCFYSKFNQLGYEGVKISCRNVSDGSFVVEFPDVRMAQKALNEAQEIGNILEAKKLKRPTPSRPRPFRVLSTTLQVRYGRTMKSRKIGQKKKGEVVLVNRTKGRRARLCIEENGSFKKIGWASLFTKGGYPLMLQLKEDPSDYCVQTKMDLNV